MEIVESYAQLDPKLRAALPKRLVEAVRQIEQRAAEASPPPLLLEIVRAYQLTIEQQRMLATALLAGASGAQGAAMFWIARLAPIEGGVLEDANRSLSWLVSQALIAPVQRPPGVPACRWRFRAGAALDRVAAVVPGPEGRAGGWEPGAADLAVDPLQPVPSARPGFRPGVPFIGLGDPPAIATPAAPPPSSASSASAPASSSGSSASGPASSSASSASAPASSVSSPASASSPASSGVAPASSGTGAVAPAPARPRRPAELSFGVLRAPAVTFDDLIIDRATREALLDAAALADPFARAVVRQPALAALFGKGRGTVLLFEGPPGTGKTLAAEALAHKLNLGLYVVSTERLVDPNFIKGLFEDAAAHESVLFLDEADDVVSARGGAAHALDRNHNACVAQLLTRLETTEGVVVMATNAGHRLDPALERRLSGRVLFPLPGPEERLQLWRRHLPPGLTLRGTLDVERLARQHTLSGARIRNAVVSATRRALRQGAETGLLVVDAAEIESAAAEQARQAYRDKGPPADGESAQVGELRQPRFDLSRVVLPEALADELAEALVTLDPAVQNLMATASFADAFPAGRGVVLLFEGPPGTGKSLTAEAVAGRLGRPLYVAHAERVTGMWMGQTEKAMARLFDEADAHGAVLLLDEADDLLSARHAATSGSDRVYNRVVDIALKRIEESKGVIILTTNMGAMLDPALERRLTGRFAFPMPEPPERAKILAALIPAELTLAPDTDLEKLARRHELSGGQLRNAVLKAIRRTLRHDPTARVIAAADLEAGLVAAAAEPARRRIGFGGEPD